MPRLDPFLVVVALALPAPSAGASESVSPSGWVRVDYGPVVDRRQLSHSGQSVGALLRKLNGRPLPAPGERMADLLIYRLLDPLLEPYAFVLPDALDSLAPPPELPLVEVGWLWQPGEAQPAWAEILRARRFVVESDGQGRLRTFLPWTPQSSAVDAALPPKESAEAAREAWQESWPVLRHVLAAEQRRLARARGGAPADQKLTVEVHPFVHHLALTTFHLGVLPYLATVTDTRGSADRPPLDLAALSAFLESGDQLEGARLEADGTLRYLRSRTQIPPSLFGGPLRLADMAVAYRAVFHGGLAEPYMSLDRDFSPWTSLVSFGGRLRDTRLGLVSLLSDLRFKTFSVGHDILARADVRERLRREIPSFRTHLERFASDPRSRGIEGQMTRLWFFPDDVELTLSPEGDLFALRRARMTAASERVLIGGASDDGEQTDPPWTHDTIAAINEDYDALARLFPELRDLDQVVRLLALFTWLREARAQGLSTPDMDVLLGVTLPACPTPRRLPNLLTYNVLPEPGDTSAVDAFDQAAVGEAFVRLDPRGGLPLPAWRRLERAAPTLDRRLPDHAALAKEIEDGEREMEQEDDPLDVLAYRAERLLMHQRTLSLIGDEVRSRLESRRAAGRAVRTLSVGIGGVDLGMSQALARAKRRGLRLGAGERGERRVEARGEAKRAATRVEPRSETDGSGSIPPIAFPDHGLGSSPQETSVALPGGRANVVSSVFGEHWIQKLSWTYEAKAEKGQVVQVVLGLGSPDVRARRRIQDPEGRAPVIERAEGPRFLRFRILPEEGGGTRVVPQVGGLPNEIARLALSPAPSRSAPSGEGPAAGLVLLEVLSEVRAPTEATGIGTATAAVAGARGEPAAVKIRLRGGGEKDLVASFPRAVLQRLVLGHEADPTPDRSLPGLSPPGLLLGQLNRLMVLLSPSQGAPPWHAPVEPLPGEEDGGRIAVALRKWWASERGASPPPAVVMGTEPVLSISRWLAAPAPAGKPLLLLPEGAFPGLAANLRDEIAKGWPERQVAASLPSKRLPDVVVLLSAEAPGPLSARLRDLARREAMRGRLLAVYSLSSPLRPDLPAALLREGVIAGLGVAEASPFGWRRALGELGELQRAFEVKADASRRVEDLPGPFLWYY